MKVWIVQVGEALPIDKDNPRLLRSGIFAQTLARRGHDVLWWASTFRHSNKSSRHSDDTRVSVDPHMEIFLLHSPGYRKNVSLARLRDHRILAEKFARFSTLEPRPDIIHCGFPTLDLSLKVAEYGQRQQVPVVLDVRDTWPDVFLQVLPRFLRPLGKVALTKAYADARSAFRLATAISGHSPGFCDYGIQLADRKSTSADRYFPFGYEVPHLPSWQIEEARSFWRSNGIVKDDSVLTVCFLGTMGSHPNFDLETPINSFRLLQGVTPNIRLILCGIGPSLERLKRRARGLHNVHFAGFVDASKIIALQECSHLGLLPYTPGSDFRMSIPNKAPEYLSGGLPILTSLNEGYLRDILHSNGIGYFYQSGKPEALAGMLHDINDKRAEIASKSTAARQYFDVHFRADKVYSEMADYLEEIALRGRKN